MFFFCGGGWLFVSILSLQTVSRKLKNNGFPKEIHIFWKNIGFVLGGLFGRCLVLFFVFFEAIYWIYCALRSIMLGLRDRIFSGKFVLKPKNTSCPKKMV